MKFLTAGIEIDDHCRWSNLYELNTHSRKKFFPKAVI